METDYQNYVESLSGVSSDDDDISTVDSSDEAEESTLSNTSTYPLQAPQTRTRNLAQMLYDREVCWNTHTDKHTNSYMHLFPYSSLQRTGFFSGLSRGGQKQKLPYERVPNRLKLYLKDVLANNAMEG